MTMYMCVSAINVRNLKPEMSFHIIVLADSVVRVSKERYIYIYMYMYMWTLRTDDPQLW